MVLLSNVHLYNSIKVIIKNNYSTKALSFLASLRAVEKRVKPKLREIPFFLFSVVGSHLVEELYLLLEKGRYMKESNPKKM